MRRFLARLVEHQGIQQTDVCFGIPFGKLAVALLATALITPLRARLDDLGEKAKEAA